MQEKVERHFVWLILLFASTALLYPDFFIGLKKFIPFGLGLIMFGIGVNTPLSCLSDTLAKPERIISLVLFRYIVMPGCALMIAYALHLTQAETIGLLVLGTAPGGIAANVMAYLSKANVSLTLLLTLGSTLLSPIITPTLIYLLLHQHVSIHVWSMMLQISGVVLLPITLGLVFNYLQIPLIRQIKSTLPVLSMLLVGMIIASILALNQQTVLTFPVMAMIAVFSLNLLGYLAGGTAQLKPGSTRSPQL